MVRHTFDWSKNDVLVCAVVVAVLIAATASVADECYVEEDDCTVCKKAGARILCGEGGITCPDDLISSDAPFKVVRDAAPNEEWLQP